MGDGRSIHVDIGFDRSVPFMRAMRYGASLQVSFVTGNEPPWHGSLSGSSRAIDAFNSCRASLGGAEMTQPFTPSTPTQPYPASPAPPPVGATNLPPIPQPG